MSSPVNYDYDKDIVIANKTELEVANILSNAYSWKFIRTNNDNKYDLLFYSPKFNQYITIEVKEDFTCARTGNVGLEYSCRGKPSGISVSKADFYAYKLHTPSKAIKLVLLPTNTLKRLITERRYTRTVNGGDLGSDSLSYLFPLTTVLNSSVAITYIGT